MKKTMYLLVIICLCLCGCESNIKDKELKEYDKNIKCSLLENKKILVSTKEYVVTYDNEVYKLNYDKLFSESNENCIMYSKSEYKIKGFDGDYLYNENNLLVDIKTKNIDKSWDNLCNIGVYDDEDCKKYSYFYDYDLIAKNFVK